MNRRTSGWLALVALAAAGQTPVTPTQEYAVDTTGGRRPELAACRCCGAPTLADSNPLCDGCTAYGCATRPRACGVVAGGVVAGGVVAGDHGEGARPYFAPRPARKAKQNRRRARRGRW